MRIVIESEVEGDVSSLFRLMLNAKPIARDFTAAQAHLLIGEIFEAALNPTDRPKRMLAISAASSFANLVLQL